MASSPPGQSRAPNQITRGCDGEADKGKSTTSEPRDRHRQQGNQSRAPSLRKQVHHHDHEANRDQQRIMISLMPSTTDRVGRAPSVVDVRGKAVFISAISFLTPAAAVNPRSIQATGKWQQWHSVYRSVVGDGVVLRPEFDSGDILTPHHATLRRLADHNLSEFFW